MKLGKLKYFLYFVIFYSAFNIILYSLKFIEFKVGIAIENLNYKDAIPFLNNYSYSWSINDIYALMYPSEYYYLINICFFFILLLSIIFVIRGNIKARTTLTITLYILIVHLLIVFFSSIARELLLFGIPYILLIQKALLTLLFIIFILATIRKLKKANIE